MKIQTIGHDKLNQLRHARYFKNIHGMVEHMKKHAASMRPKFDTVLASLEKELGGLEIGSWLAPRGGYFISFDSLDGCAKAIVAKAKEAGLIMTNAGATYPYGKTRMTVIFVLRHLIRLWMRSSGLWKSLH